MALRGSMGEGEGWLLGTSSGAVVEVSVLPAFIF